MPTTKINVSKADNELFLIAATPEGSSELCHLKSGENHTVSYSFEPQGILASGTYQLWMIGLNWGGPGEFEVTLTTDGNQQVFRSGRVSEGWARLVQIEV